MKKLPQITLDEWAQAEAEHFKIPVVPEGWYSVADYAEMKGIANPTASARLRKMWQKGLIERKAFHSPKGAPYIYRPKKK